MDDIELDDDVIFGGFHTGEHGGKRRDAVDQELGIVVARERHLGQFFERSVLRVGVLVAQAKKVHLFLKRGQYGRFASRRASRFDVTLKFAAAE